MLFDIYYPFPKDGKLHPGITPHPSSWTDIKKLMNAEKWVKIIDEVRNTGDAAVRRSLKEQLPCICWNGVCMEGKKRANANMKPTQLVMVDYDHVPDARKCWEDIKNTLTYGWVVTNVIISHVTVSGEGLRVVFVGQGKETIEDNIKWFNEQVPVEYQQYCDPAVKDFSRISFICKESDILFESARLIMNDWTTDAFEPYMKNNLSPVNTKEKSEEPITFMPFTKEEEEAYEALDFRGVKVVDIVKKYIEVNGVPSSGEIHNYYNEMVKNFRCITSNDKRALLYLLPRFGHSYEECESQIKSICRVNTLSTLPKQFYFFLKDNGFYTPKSTYEDKALKEYMLSDETEKKERPPYLPPVFKELVGTAPLDFVLPCINSLLPILGTLTSYVGAYYPYDDRLHTTSFFSVVYAPPGTGKGFVERFMDLLFEEIKMRDYVQSQRENIYLRAIGKKGANEKAPDMPHTSLRIIQPKNSEPEFLQKQRDNHGYHMFTYAAEMDSWAKGVKAAGGNKDDMIRIAWDNGTYGQNFKSANTFKGSVNLFWNVLITGTIQQVLNYFKNVENGLVTRCSFTSIDNQEFASAPKWKKLTKKNLEVINKFTERCDRNTYEKPCEIDVEYLQELSDEDFDKEVEWQFRFRPRQIIDCSWIMPTIEAFHKEQIEKAAMDLDRARDVFRRRVGVRGFRLAIMCHCLWEKPRQSDLEKCKVFIDWWMHKDIESMLALWGAKYNEQSETSPKLTQRTIFDELPEVFTRTDVYVVCTRQGVKTQVRRIIFEWKKLGCIEQLEKDKFKKKKL